MLRLSKLTDYGMVVMAALADAEDDTRNAADLAAATGVALPTVRKLLKRLNRGGLVNSARGARGGYRLARPADDISIADVIAALEGPVSLTECAAHDGLCSMESVCRLRGHWRVINDAIRDALADVSVADMNRPAPNIPLQPAPGIASSPGS